jgi:hypothetical protein
VVRQLFRAIKTTIGVIGAENAICIAITASDPIGSELAPHRRVLPLLRLDQQPA